MKAQSTLVRRIYSALMSVLLFGLPGGIIFFLFANILGRWLLMGQPINGAAFMALVVYAPCGVDATVQTVVGECIDEGSGILGILLVKRGFNLATIIDPATYLAAKTAKDIIIIKDLEAYWPTATQVTIPGLAGRMERHGHWAYDLPFKHEGVDANLVFWNTKTQKRDYGLVFITEEYKAFAALDRQLEPILCSFSAAPAGEQEFGKNRFFQGNVKWKCKDLPYLVDTLTVAMLQPDFQV